MTLPVLIVLHQEQSTPGRVGHYFQSRGVPLDIRRPRCGDPLPDTLAAHAGAVIFVRIVDAHRPAEDDCARMRRQCVRERIAAAGATNVQWNAAGLEIVTDAAGRRLLLMQHDQNGQCHRRILAVRNALRIARPRQNQTVGESEWQAAYAHGTYGEDADLCRLNCERATWRSRKPLGRIRGRKVTNLFATPGIITLCPCIRAAYPAAAMSAG